MLEELFNIENFNIVSDDNYYYFFRALNNRDHSDIEKGIITDTNGLHTIKTDREHYEGNSKYTEDSTLSLEEVFDHIKMHHRIDTNCISLTSNANVGIMYGREYYHDEYAIVRVPKSELGNSVVLAGLYMMQEIEKKIDEYISNGDIDELTKYYLDLVDNVLTQEKLDEITSTFKEESYDDSMFQKGIEYIKQIINPKYYSSLSSKQNLQKNKVIAKLSIVGKQILPNVTNKFLTQTIGLAFSSLELVHYNNITKEKIIDCPKEIMDLFALLQQSNNPLSKELELFLIQYLNNPSIYKFRYEDYNISDNDITIDALYNMTNGSMDYIDINNLYKKTYYLSKSKLRTISAVKFLREITDNNSRYESLFNEMLSTTYGVEPEIFIKSSENKFALSESIGLDIDNEQLNLLEYVNKLEIKNLEYVVEEPNEAINLLIHDLKLGDKKTDKEEWYANAIIDSFDWKSLNISSISILQRQELVEKLIEKNCIDIYYKLKEKGIPEKNISNTLLTSIIKNKDIDNIDINETFSIEEIENFLGYYKLKDYSIKLRGYQATSVKNIEECFQKHKFAAAILPTGAGKSFVALTEMLKFKDQKILYIAPNDTILTQLEDYIVEYIRGKKGTFGKFTSESERREIIKEVFPNLALVTYHKLNRDKLLRENKYDLIILDELHRSGAKEWIRNVEELFNNQNESVRVLGITATPERDCDGVDMANYWAKYFGYTKTEINKHKHLAINMDIYEAIKLGYVVNSKVVSCVYDLLRGNGELDDLLEQINCIKDKTVSEELTDKYKKLRKKIEEADGVKKILNENLKKGKKYIVFCPAINEDGRSIEDEDGNIIDVRITGEEVIKKYIRLLGEYLGEENIECYSMLGEYSKSKNRRQLDLFEKGNKEKITFMVVINKLNEGSHVKNDGLIWFRALDSSILCSQQFGRIVFSLEPGQVIPDEDIPIAIDLTNNLLRIKMNEEKSTSRVDDLDKLKIIVDWINEYNKFPDINSEVKIESRYASILKSIQKKYNKYHDRNLLLKQTEDSIDFISEILELGNSIDLWNIKIPKKIKKKNKKEENTDLLTLSGLLRDFYDLKKEAELHLPKLSLEKRIEEIYNVYLNTGEIPKTSNKNLRFTNGAVMSTWLYYFKNRPRIIECAENGNEYAKIIVEKANLDTSTYEIGIEKTKTRLKYIYENYVLTNKKIPKQSSKELFPDGNVIGIWIRRAGTKKYINILVKNNDEYAKKVVEYLGWNNQVSYDKMVKQRIEYIYEEYISKGKDIPKKLSVDRFEDGCKIHVWLIRKKTRAELIRLSKCGNIYAKAIVEDCEFYQTKEERIKKLLYKKITYVYEKYILKGITIPDRYSDDIFDDGSGKIGDWLRRNKKSIMTLAENNDEKAKKIVELSQWKETKVKDSFEEELKYVYEEFKIKNKDFMVEKENALFPSGKRVLNWFYLNCKKIETYANAGNIYAKYIVAEMEKTKTENIFRSRLEYLYDEYILKNKSLPSQQSKDTFEDGVKIYGWIQRVNVKEKLRATALEGDEKAISIARCLNIKIEKKLNKERVMRKIDYIVDTYIEKGKKIPASSSLDVFEFDGTRVREWINSHREILKSLANDGEEGARKIIDDVGYDMNTKSKAIVKRRLRYLVEEYIKKGKKIPISRSQGKFKDNDVSIGVWIRMQRTKEIIQELIAEDDMYAKEVYKAIEWDVIYTKEEQKIKRIEYIYNAYIVTGKEIPSINSDEPFEDGIKIRAWIKQNKDFIVNMSISENQYAKALVEKLKLDKPPEERFKEKTVERIKIKLQYLYDNYIAKGLSMPKHDSLDQFEDGAPIYKWLNRTSVKDIILKIACEGDLVAQKVIEHTTWGKKSIINLAPEHLFALKSSLDNGWILEKDIREYPSYKKIEEENLKIKK